MKKVVLISAAMAFALLLTSCKNNTSSEVLPTNTETQKQQPLALTEASNNTIKHLYVTAPSGLSLREYGNLQSQRLAKMPFGTRVDVLEPETKTTMTVSGIPGGMHHIAYNHKKGFAFNGYLSRYFPPEPGISAEGYAVELRALFPEVMFEEVTGGTVSRPSTTERLMLPGAQWHEAFFTAQQLFDFPKEFRFPGMSGKDSETIEDSFPKESAWTSQLEVTRSDDSLQKIVYRYTSASFNWNVEIVKEGNTMILSRTEIIK